MDDQLDASLRYGIPKSLSFDGLIADESDEDETASVPQFRCGDVIMQESPFASVVENDQTAHICHHCFKRSNSEALRRCARCKFARYCNEDCSKAGWKVHKFECTLLLEYSTKRGFFPDSLIRLVNLVIMRVKAGQTKMPPESCSPPTERDFTTLMSHTEDIDEELIRSDKFKQNISEIAEYLSPNVSLSFGDEMLTETYSKVMTNCIGIVDKNGTQLGTGLYFGISQFDHSCLPNAVYFARSGAPTVSIVATRNVGKMEDVRISYVNPMKPTLQRRAELKESHYFVCRCGRCCSFEHDGMTRSLNCGLEGCEGFILLGKDEFPMGECEKCGWRMEKDDQRLLAGRKLMNAISEAIRTLHNESDLQVTPEILTTLTALLEDAKEFLFVMNYFRIRLTHLVYDLHKSSSSENSEAKCSFDMLEEIIATTRFYLGPVSLELFQLYFEAFRQSSKNTDEKRLSFYQKLSFDLAKKLFPSEDPILKELS